MARYRVFDEETAGLLRDRISSDPIDLVQTGEYFSADAGEVILAPSMKAGDVLYIRIRNAVPTPPPSVNSELVEVAAEPQAREPEPTPFTPDSEKPRHYVATGILGLDGEMEEEAPAPPRPWWKKLFLD